MYRSECTNIVQNSQKMYAHLHVRGQGGGLRGQGNYKQIIIILYKHIHILQTELHPPHTGNNAVDAFIYMCMHDIIFVGHRLATKVFICKLPATRGVFMGDHRVGQ